MYSFRCRLVWVTKNSSEPTVKWGSASGNYTHEGKVCDIMCRMYVYAVRVFVVKCCISGEQGPV